MYWSGVQSTGAEMRKYLTGRWCQRTAEGLGMSQVKTYGYRPAEEPLGRLGAGSAELRLKA